MIKVLIALSMILGVYSCGKQNKNTQSAETPAQVIEAAPSNGTPEVQPQVIANNGSQDTGSVSAPPVSGNTNIAIMPVIPQVSEPVASYTADNFKKDIDSFLTVKTEGENIKDKILFLEKISQYKNLNLVKYQDALLKCSGGINIFTNKEFLSLRFLCLAKILEENIPYTKTINQITNIALSSTITNNYFVRGVVYKYFAKYPELINDQDIRSEVLAIYKAILDKKLTNEFDNLVFDISLNKNSPELNNFLLDNFLKTELDNVRIFKTLAQASFDKEIILRFAESDKKEIYYDFICDLAMSLKNKIQVSKDLVNYFNEKTKLTNQSEGLFYKNNCKFENPYKVIGGKI